jgi:hypothetical protein
MNRKKNIEANTEGATEYHSESFGIVVMLYIYCKFNGHHWSEVLY